MTEKHPIDRQRIRTVPTKFSWIDHRLVRDRHIEYCSHAAAALYLFLVTVSDKEGLSYYSDASLMQRLAMGHDMLLSARQNLIRLGLLTYKKPLYQVLSLEQPPIESRTTSFDGPQQLGDILKKIAEGRP